MRCKFALMNQEKKKIVDRQDLLSTEIKQLRSHINEQEDTKSKLLERISLLEKSKQKQQEYIRQLHQDLKEKDQKTKEEEKEEEKERNVPMEVDEHAPTMKNPLFEKFLELRKKLRRSIFRGEEVKREKEMVIVCL